MRTINALLCQAAATLLWQVAFILLLVCLDLDPFAWFVGGMAAMFWFIVVILAKGVSNE